MKLFSLLFGRKKKPPPRIEPRAASPSVIPLTTQNGTQTRAHVQWRGYPISVVGTIHNQEALIALCGPYTLHIGVGDTFGFGKKFDALIEFEPTNPHDPNAIAVKIRGYRMGYLPKREAARVGQQMREEKLDAAGCDAIVDGGWRVNQHEGGLRPYAVRLGIPQEGWIDFGIGSLPPIDPKTNRPISSGRGPLQKEWIALVGIEPDSDTARQLAKDGARFMVNPGARTTLLVVGESKPFSDQTKRTKAYRKAEELITQQGRLRIVSLDEVKAMAASGEVGR